MSFSITLSLKGPGRIFAITSVSGEKPIEGIEDLELFLLKKNGHSLEDLP